jgi:predicted RNA binding protein YcfA (HicA-like mRNA interferase family)
MESDQEQLPVVKDDLAGGRLPSKHRPRTYVEKEGKCCDKVPQDESGRDSRSNRTMPKRYTSRELIKMAKRYGWSQISTKGDHHNFKHSRSRFVVTIIHPQKDVPVGRSVDTVKKIQLEIK